MAWVNVAGIVLEFVGFWCAAPQILGEERLRRVGRWVEEALDAPADAFWRVGLLVALLAVNVRCWLGGFERGVGLRPAVAFVVGLVVLLGGLELGRRVLGGKIDTPKPTVIGCLCLLAAPVLSALLLGWRAVVTALLSILVVTAVVPVAGVWASSLLYRLARDARIRRLWLRAGAVLFALGFLLEIGAAVHAALQ